MRLKIISTKIISLPVLFVVVLSSIRSSFAYTMLVQEILIKENSGVNSRTPGIMFLISDAGSFGYTKLYGFPTKY